MIKKILHQLTYSFKVAKLDKMGIRAFTKYSCGTGKWAIEIYRKKTKNESTGDGDWRMIREGSVVTYFNRIDAEINTLKKADEILKEYYTNEK